MNETHVGRCWKTSLTLKRLDLFGETMFNGGGGGLVGSNFFLLANLQHIFLKLIENMYV